MTATACEVQRQLGDIFKKHPKQSALGFGQYKQKYIQSKAKTKEIGKSTLCQASSHCPVPNNKNITVTCSGTICSHGDSLGLLIHIWISVFSCNVELKQEKSNPQASLCIAFILLKLHTEKSLDCCFREECAVIHSGQSTIVFSHFHCGY